VTGDGEWVLAVRERHRDEQVTHELVAVSIGAPGREATLAWGRDFFAARGRLRRNPGVVAVLDHPHMSWDESELWVAHLESGPTGSGDRRSERVAGGRGFRSANQCGATTAHSSTRPMTTDGGSPGVGSGRAGRRLSEEHAEFHGPDWGLARPRWPSWRTARSWSCGGARARPHRRGRARRWPLTEIDQPCVEIDSVTANTAPHCGWGDRIGGALALVVPERAGGPYAGRVTPLLADADIAVAEPFSFVSEHDRVVHGLFYAPRWADGRPGGEWPPLVVACHGGPTAGARPGSTPRAVLHDARLRRGRC